MKRKICFLSTNDNPYNPIKEFDKWFEFDTSHQYNTLNYFGTFFTQEDLISDELYDEEVERVCDEIVAQCPRGDYIKVVEYIDEEEIEVPDEYLPLKEDLMPHREPVGGSATSPTPR